MIVRIDAKIREKANTVLRVDLMARVDASNRTDSDEDITAHPPLGYSRGVNIFKMEGSMCPWFRVHYRTMSQRSYG